MIEYLANNENQQLVDKHYRRLSTTHVDTSIENLVDGIIDDLIDELQLDEDSEKVIISRIVENATTEVIDAFNFPDSFGEERKLKDLRSAKGNIRNLSIYKWNQRGGEFQIEHNENGVSRTWSSYSTCFKGIVPYVE